jgi:hypothetical protein
MCPAETLGRLAAKARPVACPPRHRAGSGRRSRSHRGKAPSNSRVNSKRPAALDGVPRPLPWARCAETVVGGGIEGGHRPYQAIADEDDAGGKRLMRRWGEQETTLTRSRPAVLRGPSATRLRSFPSANLSRHVTGRGSRHHGRERAPGAFRRGREASPFTLLLSTEFIRCPRSCGKTNIPTNNNTSVAAGIRARQNYMTLKSPMKKQAAYGYGVWIQYPCA